LGFKVTPQRSQSKKYMQASLGIVSVCRASPLGHVSSHANEGMPDSVVIAPAPSRPAWPKPRASPATPKTCGFSSMIALPNGVSVSSLTLDPEAATDSRGKIMADKTAKDAFPIGILALRSGVNIETVRYYEKIDIMPKTARSSGGYRLYTTEHLKRLTFIRRGRELGFTLDELRTLLRLVDGHAYTCAEVRALMLDHVADIRRKVADLRRLERAMTAISSRCSGRRVPDCPIIDALFQPDPLASPRGNRA
jgi:MerR family transcriptional regulator, mercuric resistance operon regulatory protein